MTKFSDAILDAALQYIVDNADDLVLCSQLPTTFTEANSTYRLARRTNVAFSAIEDREGGGRQVRLTTFSTGTVHDDSLPATHEALLDQGNSDILYVREMPEPVDLDTAEPFAISADLVIGFPNQDDEE